MKFLKILKKLASFSDHPQHRMSCVIADKSKIVSLGFNQLKTHPKANNTYRMLHAEISATSSLNPVDTKGYTAYVYRERKDGQLAMAKPCKFCESMLRSMGIRNIVYSTENSWKEEMI